MARNDPRIIERHCEEGPIRQRVIFRHWSGLRKGSRAPAQQSRRHRSEICGLNAWAPFAIMASGGAVDKIYCRVQELPFK